jgi:hypothetical protein
VTAERFPIEEGHIAAFARSVGDANPAYYGPEAIAPPTFVQASAQWDPDYPLRPKIGGQWWGSGREPGGAPSFGGGQSMEGKSEKSQSGGGGGGTGLHAEQHYEYARPVRAGDVLTATTKPGKTWEKEGRRAGKLVFSESITEYRDQNGELVVTARGVGVRTEKPVES